MKDSLSHLYTPDNAIASPTVSLLLECLTSPIAVNIKGVMRRLITDTDPNVSILQPGISGSDVKVTTMKPYGVTGQALDIKEQQSAYFELDWSEFNHMFLVCSAPYRYSWSVRQDFMEGTGAIINFECGKMFLTDIGTVPRAHSDPLTGHVSLNTSVHPARGKCSIYLRDNVISVSGHNTISCRQMVHLY